MLLYIIGAYWLTTIIVNWFMIWWQGEDAPVGKDHWVSYLVFVLLSPFTLSETINATLINWNKREQLKSGLALNLMESLEDTEFADLPHDILFAMITAYAEEGDEDDTIPFETTYDLCRYYKEQGRLAKDDKGWHFDLITNSED